MSKENNNPFADAELSIADAIRTNPVISGLDFGKQNKIEVFATSAESAKEFIKKKIKGNIGICVFVSLDRIDSVSKEEYPKGDAEFLISVVAPAVLSEPYTTTTNIATAIIEQLHYTVWSFPFASPFMFSRFESTTEEDGSISRDLYFTTKINLTTNQ